MGSNSAWTGMSIGVAIGVAWWLLLDNVAFLGAGMAIGVAIGAGVDRKNDRDKNDP